MILASLVLVTNTRLKWWCIFYLGGQLERYSTDFILLNGYTVHASLQHGPALFSQVIPLRQESPISTLFTFDTK